MSEDVNTEALAQSAEDRDWERIASAVEETGSFPEDALESLVENPVDSIVQEGSSENISLSETENGDVENFSGVSQNGGIENTSEGDNSAWIDSVLNNLVEGGTSSVDSPVVDSGNTKNEDFSANEDIIKKTKELLGADEKTKEILDLYGDDLDAHMLIALKMREAMGIDDRLAKAERAAERMREEEERAKGDAWNAEVEKEIPNWRDIINKDKRFPGWFEQQSNIYKKCLKEASAPSDVVEALKKFQRDVGLADTRMSDHRNLYGNPMNDVNVVRNIGAKQQITAEELWAQVAEDVEKGFY